MKFANALKVCLGLGLCFFLSQTNLYAQGQAFVTVVHPIRGSDFWGSKPGSPLSGVKFQKELVEKESLAATWLLRSDALEDGEIVNFFRQPFFENSRQERGIFLEIMPGLAKAAEVIYPSGGVFWHDANKIFLSGYRPEERKKLIDTVFAKFREVFGSYPQSVGAWHIDAFSAAYMREKYGVTAVLICADQFGTDGYQIWGGWWGVPFYPSKFNILMPAQTKENKLDVVVFWWAARDPLRGYGGSFEESTFSVQVNDYVYHSKGIEYFEQLLDTYLKNPANRFQQLTVGIENDYDFGLYGVGYGQQLVVLKKRETAGEIKTVTMAGFTQWYRQNFKEVSPEHQIGGWVMSPYFRAGSVEKDGQTFLRDLRIYDENWPEANFLTANPWGTLSLSNPYKIDSVRFPQKELLVAGNLSLKNLLNQFGQQKIPFRQDRFWLLVFFLFILVSLVWSMRKNLSRLILTITGTAAWSLTMVKSGLVYPFGMGFWGANGHDGIWHISLINQLAKFSLNHPIFAGVKLTNYHFGFDLMVAFLHLITRISVINLYFQILPPVMAALVGALTYKLVDKWTSSKKGAWWATFFVYFGGSWGWLVNFIRQGTFGGESMFWSSQSIQTLINPPFALSLIFILFGLIKFLDYKENQKVKDLIVCSLMFGLLAIIKVYAGIIVLGSLLVGVLIDNLIFRKKETPFLKVFPLSLLITLVTFLPFNQNVSSLLVFKPFWFLRTMLISTDRLYWPKLENARFAYFYSGQFVKWIAAEVLILLIFVFGNLGMRFLALLEIKRRFRPLFLADIEIIFFSGIIISLIVPLLFIQEGTAWNTIQFFYYCQFILAILAGIAVGRWWEKQADSQWRRLSIAGLLMMFTLPTSLNTLKADYLPGRPPARISIEELEALAFLRQQPQGVVLTYPFNPDWRNKFSDPRPLYAYETTGYIAALSGQPSFLADEMNLEISGYKWQERREESIKFFLTNNHSFANSLLQQNKIAYIYLVKGQKINLGEDDIHSRRIFENGEVKIFKIN